MKYAGEMGSRAITYASGVIKISSVILKLIGGMYIDTDSMEMESFIHSFNSFYFVLEHRASTKHLEWTLFPARLLTSLQVFSAIRGLFFNSSVPSCSWSTSPSLLLGVPVQSLPLYCTLIFT
jgi:hypothetical protein